MVKQVDTISRFVSSLLEFLFHVIFSPERPRSSDFIYPGTTAFRVHVSFPDKETEGREYFTIISDGELTTLFRVRRCRMQRGRMKKRLRVRYA